MERWRTSLSRSASSVHLISLISSSTLTARKPPRPSGTGVALAISQRWSPGPVTGILSSTAGLSTPRRALTVGRSSPGIGRPCSSKISAPPSTSPGSAASSSSVLRYPVILAAISFVNTVVPAWFRTMIPAGTLLRIASS
jgi:hypothetical protein